MLRVMVTFVAARHRDSLLPALRTSTVEATEFLWCVAFVSVAGLHLVERELKQVRGRRRLLATGVFGGDSSRAALTHAATLGLDVRVLNLGGGTYHPKIYLFDGPQRRGLVGSANLTGGLICNVEAVVWMDDTHAASAIDDVWALGEELWNHSAARPWEPGTAIATPPDSMSESLLSALLVAMPEGTVVPTLAGQRPNRVAALTADAVWVETERSARAGLGTQPVPGWMLQLAYDRLRSHGTMTNATLLNELRVHRSSFVCAALARLPDVEVASRSPITLRWRGPLSTEASPVT